MRAARAGAGLLAAVLLSACGNSGATPSGKGTAGVEDGFHGAVLDERYALADETLVDTDGEPFRLHEELDAPVTLVFFGYSNCPDICQAVMADLASTKARLAEADAEKVQVWFVTTDPARDDPATLRTYLDRFDPEFEGVTGKLPAILEVARSVHVPVEKGPKLETGGYDVTHGTPVLAVTPDGEVPVLWTEGTSAAKLAADVTTLVRDGAPAPSDGEA